MPLRIKKTSGGKYQVVEPSGKVLGTHPSRKAAKKQIVAVEISKRRRGK